MAFLAFYASQKYFFYTFFNLSKAIGLGESDSFVRMLHAQEKAMTHIFTGTMLLVTCVTLLYALYFSHRIAGPLYRLHQYLRQKIEGAELKELRFRGGDYFTELADVTNELFHSLKDKKRLD